MKDIWSVVSISIEVLVFWIMLSFLIIISQKWHILHQYFKNKELNAVIWCKIDALKRDQNLHSAYYFWPELKYFPTQLDTYLWKVTDAFSIIFMQWSIIKKLWNIRIIINMYKLFSSLDSSPEQNLFWNLFRLLHL